MKVQVAFLFYFIALGLVTSFATSCGKVAEVEAPSRLEDDSELPEGFDSESFALTASCPDPVKTASDDALSCAKTALLDAASILNPAETATKIGQALTWFKQANDAISKLRPILEKLRPTSNIQASAPKTGDNLARDCFLELSKQIDGSFKAAEAIDALDLAQQSDNPVKAAAALVTLSRFALALTKSTHGSCVKMLTPRLQTELNKIFGDAVKNLGVISTLMQCGIAITNGTYVLVGQTRLYANDMKIYYASEQNLLEQRKRCLRRTIQSEQGCGTNFGIWLHAAGRTLRGGDAAKAKHCVSNCATSKGSFNKNINSQSANMFWAADSLSFCRENFKPGSACGGPAVDACISMCCNQEGGCVKAAAKENSACKENCQPQDVFIRDCSFEIANSIVARDVQSCDIKGEKYRTINGCLLEDCQPGFQKSGNSCMKISCTPGSQIEESCHVANSISAARTKTCNSQGSGFNFGDCKATSCASGFKLVNDQCMSLCTANQPVGSEECSVSNSSAATRTKTCNAQGTGFNFGACRATSCVSGFTLSNGACVKQCIPHKVVGTESCAVANSIAAIRTKICNSQATGFYLGECKATSCATGFKLSNGACVPLCTPGQSGGTESCSVLNSIGATRAKTCNAQGTGYDFGECMATSCAEGFKLNNGICVSLCTPNQSVGYEFCSTSNSTAASRTKSCNAQGTGFDFGDCRATSCAEGYRLSNGACVSLCTPNQYAGTESCSVPNSTAATRTKTCNFQGTGFNFGSCQATRCASGYKVSNGACVVASTFATVGATADWTFVGYVNGNFRLNASGTTYWAGPGSQATPDGIVGNDCCQGCNILPGNKHMTLIGRVNGGTPFRVGSSYFGFGLGMLELRVNDTCQSDNGGSFSIELSGN